MIYLTNKQVDYLKTCIEHIYGEEYKNIKHRYAMDIAAIIDFLLRTQDVSPDTLTIDDSVKLAVVNNGATLYDKTR